MKLSVVIACRNGSKTLEQCLRSLAGMDRAGVEVIVADDGSTDESAAVAERLGARVLHLSARGRAAALNDGIEAARGDGVLFTDADCVVPRTWADDLERYLLRGFEGVGGNLIPSAWTVVETAKVLRYIHEFRGDFVLEGRYSGMCLNGNNMAILRSALAGVGGFDAGYLHGADADLTRRLLEAGCRLLRTRSIETTHLKVDSLGSFLDTFSKRGSAVRFAMRDGPLPENVLRRAYLSPFARLFKDFWRTPEMKGRFPEAGIASLAAAPFAHFLADLRAASGQSRYHRQFSKEAKA